MMMEPIVLDLLANSEINIIWNNCQVGNIPKTRFTETATGLLRLYYETFGPIIFDYN